MSVASFGKKLSAHHITRRPAYIVLIAVLILGTIASFIQITRFFELTTHQKLTTSPSYTEESALWLQKIRHDGAINAYQEFVTAVTQDSALLQHTRAHAFGDALFQAQGVAGVATCGDEFNQGCEHAIIGHAVRELGLTATIDTLTNICRNKSAFNLAVSCEHGLGHGILGYQGYDLQSLAQALHVCEKNTATVNRDLGCFGGVFMEYSEHLLERTDTIPAKLFTPETRYEPCVHVAPVYRDACMFWQPFWWNLSSNLQSRPLSPTALGALCRGAEKISPHAVRACFSGYGYLLPSIKNNAVSDILNVCIQSSQNVHERLACWSWSFKNTTADQHKLISPKICESLPSRDHAYCRNHQFDVVDLTVTAPRMNE